MSKQYEELKKLNKDLTTKISEKEMQLRTIETRHELAMKSAFEYQERKHTEALLYKEQQITQNKLEKEKMKGIIQEKELQNKKYEDIIKDLQDKLAAKITNITTTNNNNIINNLSQYLPPSFITKQINEKLTDEHMFKGIPGIANFTIENILIDSNGRSLYICKDASRQTFYFCNMNGIKIKDVKAKKLMELITSEIKAKFIQSYNFFVGISKQIGDQIDDPDEDIFLKENLK